MAENGTFKNVFEGESVENFMAAFVLPSAERARLEAQHPKTDFSTFPDSIEKVRRDIKTIWQEHGFITPAVLQAKLTEKYIPDADPAVLKFIHDIELSRNTPDAVTGYVPKEHAYVATGLAHLFALETQRKMTMVEVDFSNMGGTNDYFQALLAKERDCHLNDVSPREARAMTDQAVLLLCRGLVSDLQSSLPVGASITPIRTGGDELRILIDGVNNEKQMQQLTDLLHAGIEKRCAAMGLQDHPHLKDPTNPVRNGFGAALALQDMGSIIKTNTLIQQLDGRIGQAKSDMGMLRLGRIDRDMVQVEWQAKVNSGRVKIPKGDTAHNFIATQVALAAATAQQAAQALRTINPAYNPTLKQGSAGFKQYVADFMSNETGIAAFDHAPLPRHLSHTHFAEGERSKNVAPMASLHARRVDAVKSDMAEKGIKISPAHWRMIDKSLSGLCAIDPAAEVMMPQMMVPTILALAKDHADFKKQFNINDKDTKAACAKAGIKPHEIGAPQGMVVSFHNLAGLNSALGHHYTDIILRHMVQGVIGKALKEAGIPMKMPEPVLIAHEGGANFTMVVSAGLKGSDGKPFFVSEKVMQQVEKNIAKRTAQLNNTNVAKFLKGNGVQITPNLKNYLVREKIDTFADIKDPKPRTMNIGDHRLTGLANGLGVVTASATVKTTANDGKINGYIFLDTLRHQAEEKMMVLRQGALMNGFVASALSQIQNPTQSKFGGIKTMSPVENLFHALPQAEHAGMPPEVQSLVHFRQLAKTTPLSKVMPLFERQYNSLLASGGLMEVGKWLQQSHTTPVSKHIPAAMKAPQHKNVPKNNGR